MKPVFASSVLALAYTFTFLLFVAATPANNMPSSSSSVAHPGHVSNHSIVIIFNECKYHHHYILSLLFHHFIIVAHALLVHRPSRLNLLYTYVYVPCFVNNNRVPYRHRPTLGKIRTIVFVYLSPE